MISKIIDKGSNPFFLEFKAVVNCFGTFLAYSLTVKPSAHNGIYVSSILTKPTLFRAFMM